MNHSLSPYVAAAFALFGISACFDRAAKSDFELQYQGTLPASPDFALEHANCQTNTAGYLKRLQRKTLFSFLWVAVFSVAAGLLVVWRVPSGSSTHLISQQYYSAAPVFAFAWATLGRLG